MVHIGNLVSGAAWNIGGKVIQLTLSLIALAVIARFVGPEAYGIFALGWLVVGLFEVFVSAAPMEALIQRKGIHPGHLDATFWATLLMALLISGGVFVFADLAVGWLAGGALLAAILPLRAAVLPLQALAAAPTALLLRRSRFKALAGAETATSVLSSVVGVGMALTGAGIWSLVAMELVRAAVLCASVYALARWRPGFAARPSHVVDLLAFNATTWGSWGLSYVSSQLPRFLIAAVLDAHAVGFYALAQRLFEQVKNIVMIPAYQVVQAGIARAQDDTVTSRRLTEGALQVTGVVSCPLFLGLAGLAPLLVPAVFGSAWAGAIPVVQVMMVLGILSSMSVVQAAVVRGMGKPHWELVYEAVLLIVTTVLMMLAVPHGLVIATAAVVLSAAVAAPVAALLVRVLTGLSIRAQMKAGFGAGFASLAMAGGVWLVGLYLAAVASPAVCVTALVVVGASLYWAMLSCTMPAAARATNCIAQAALRRDSSALRAMLATIMK